MKTFKIFSLIIFISFPFFCSAQNNSSLPTQEFVYSKEINLTQPYFVIIEKPYTIYSNPKLNKESLLKVVKANSKIFLIELIKVDDIVGNSFEKIMYNTNELIRVKYKNTEGYINPYEQRTILKIENDISDWLKASTDSYFNKRRMEREIHLKKNYGDSTGIKLINLKFELGMTKAMIIDAVGEPNDINVTQGEFGKHEQIVYKNYYNLNSKYGYKLFGGPIYFYIENGKLTAVQY